MRRACAVGCARTLDEIAAWSTMSDVAKRAVWQQLALRRPAPHPADKGESDGA